MKSRGPPWDDGEMVLQLDRWTRYQWNRFLDEQPAAKESLMEGGQRYPGYPRLTRDLFARLFAEAPQRVQSHRPEDGWVVKLHDALDELPEMGRLERRTRGDRTSAGKAAMWLAEQTLASLREPPPKADPQPLREQVEGLIALAEANRGLLDEELHAHQLESLRAEGKVRVEAARAYSEGLDNSDLRRALREGLAQASERLDALEARLASFLGWGNSASVMMSTEVEVKAELSRRLSEDDKVRQLAEEAGRLRRIAARKHRGRVDHGADEVADIERGADLGRLLPVELAKLADPMRMPEVARGIAERSLLQFRLRGTDSLGRGPIVVLVDQSSSMEGAAEIWSKAFALALLEVATLQKRACRVVHFNQGVVRIDDWAPGRVAPLELVESMVPFAGGGTDFEPPLRAALEAVKANPKLKKADVVLITDGACEVSQAFADEWKRARVHLDVNAYGVYIGEGVPPAVLSTVADEVLALEDVRKDHHVTEALLGL